MQQYCHIAIGRCYASININDNPVVFIKCLCSRYKSVFLKSQNGAIRSRIVTAQTEEKPPKLGAETYNGISHNIINRLNKCQILTEVWYDVVDPYPLK